MVQVLQEGESVGDCHKGHENRVEEDCVDEGLDVILATLEAEEDCAHEDGKAEVHYDTYAVYDDVTDALI
jgi:hypothetical protein